MVDYAIKLPGPDKDTPVYLPIDAKFPSGGLSENSQGQRRSGTIRPSKRRAKSWRRRSSWRPEVLKNKYLNPPFTTDFAILFLPTEGLHAQLLERPGLVERLQREDRVMLAGPVTLSALLNSLSLGLRTLSIGKDSTQVLHFLFKVKTKFKCLEDSLSKMQEKLNQANNEMERALKEAKIIKDHLQKAELLDSEE